MFDPCSFNVLLQPRRPKEVAKRRQHTNPPRAPRNSTLAVPLVSGNLEGALIEGVQCHQNLTQFAFPGFVGGCSLQELPGFGDSLDFLGGLSGSLRFVMFCGVLNVLPLQGGPIPGPDLYCRSWVPCQPIAVHAHVYPRATKTALVTTGLGGVHVSGTCGHQYAATPRRS